MSAMRIYVIQGQSNEDCKAGSWEVTKFEFVGIGCCILNYALQTELFCLQQKLINNYFVL